MKTASNTNRTEMVKALKELEAKASGDQWDSIGESISTSDMVDIDGEGDRYIEIPYDEHDAEFIAAFRNAAPWLLRIAEAFQPGDAEKLKYVPCFRLDGDCDKCSDKMRGACECVRRLQAVAEEMER